MDPADLARWVGQRRGRPGDLISYRIERELLPQIEAGLDTPCAGGGFYRPRWVGAILGIEENRITGEIGYDPESLLLDVRDLEGIRRDLWVAAPAPGGLGISDRYFLDAEEAGQSLYSAYRGMMRAMRDAGTAGHVLLCDEPSAAELEALAGRKVFFFCRARTRRALSLLLEYQQVVAVTPGALGIVAELMEEYEVQKIVLIDAAEGEIDLALRYKDREDLVCGGYCPGSCPGYWRSLVGRATVLK